MPSAGIEQWGLERDAINGQGEEMTLSQKRRKDYSELIIDTKRDPLRYTKPGSIAGLNQTLDKAEELFKQIPVGECSEAVLDSRLINHCASLAVEQAKQVHSRVISFESSAFAANLLDFLTSDRVGRLAFVDEGSDKELAAQGRSLSIRKHQLDWMKLGHHCQKVFRRRAPTVDFMYGALATRKKKKAASQRRQALPVGPKFEPEKLHSTEAYEEATTKEVERIGQVLVAELTRAADQSGLTIEETRISYFDFVLHPTSFGQTIENIFHVSFLLNSGKAAISIEDDRLPYIHLIPRARGADYDELSRNHFIISLDMKGWKELVTAFNVKEAAIPPRLSVVEEQSL